MAGAVMAARAAQQGGATGAAGGAPSVSGERLYQQLSRQARSRQVLSAIRAVPREQFLDASMLPYAGDDTAALPIGHEQTTSAPFVIMRMLEMMLDGRAFPLRVLEVGGGCGYQTALLAEAGCTVVSIERLRPLALAARRRMETLGYGAVTILHGDGLAGAAAQAPFDGIVVCAECADIPPALPPQLAADGRLVLPLRRKKNEVRLAAVNAAGALISLRDSVRFVNIVEGVG